MMAAPDGSARKPAAARRAGYAVAAAVDGVLLFLVNGSPGWAALPFVTGDLAELLTLLNVSLVAGLVVNLVQVGYDPPWLVAAGGIVTTGIGLAVLIRFWQVFPFDFGASSAWGTAARVLLVVAIVGSIAGLLVQAVSLARAVSRAPNVRPVDHEKLTRP